MKSQALIQLLGVSVAFLSASAQSLPQPPVFVLPEPPKPDTVTEAAPAFAPGEPLAPSAQVGGVWSPLGPAPTRNGQVSIPPNNEVCGAVQAIAAHPTNPDVLYIGGVNGGIWRTLNATAASPTWTPLTDTLTSLSIGAVELDPTDTTSQTLVVGTARTSSFGAVGGALIGVLRSTDGGNTWSVLGTATFVNEHLISVAARSNIVMAASDNAWAGGNGSGLFRSTNFGAAWTLISGAGGTGLSAGSVSDLVGDPVNSNRLYAAVRTVGIFRSDDAGATWVNVTGTITGISGSTTKIEMAVHNSGSASAVYVAVINSGTLASVWRSGNLGASWTQLDTPVVNLGSQGTIHFSIAADRNSTNIVYIGGDRIAGSPFTGNLFRGNASSAPGSQFTTIMDANATNTTPHADSREMVTDANGNLIQGDDGGLYRRSSPQSSAGAWSSVIGNLALFEAHDVAYDSVAKVGMVGTQDNGTHIQSLNGSQVWTFISGGDGGDVAIDDQSTVGQSVRYGSSQNLGGFYRKTYNAANTLLSTDVPARTVVGGGPAITNQFITPVELNKVTPTRLIIGGANAAYESLNRGDTVTALTPISSVNGTFSGLPIAYGGWLAGVPNPDVLYYGSGSSVKLRTTAGGAVVTTAGAFPGSTVQDIVLDTNDWRRVFVTGSSAVYYSTNSGTNWVNITGNLTGVGSLHTLEFFGLNGTDCVAIGTDLGVYCSFVNDLGNWLQLGAGLPNVVVYDMTFNPRDNVLVVGTMGQGTFLLPISTSPVLNFVSNALSGGNGNQSVDPNECNDLRVAVRNDGNGTATNVIATLTTSTPGVTIFQPNSAYPNISSGATVTNTTAFKISTEPSFVCGTPVNVTLTLVYVGGTNALSFSLPSGGGNYTITPSTGAVIVPGSTDVGNHGDDVVTTIALPFGYSFYGQSFSNAELSSNGDLQFLSSDNAWENAGCLPATAFNFAILPHWDDLRTDAVGSGIFTSTSGGAPNRVFNIEWRATYYNGGASLNFEVRLYEGQPRVDLIYGALNGTGSSATVGIQKDTGSDFAQFECNAGGLSNGLQLTFSQLNCPDGGGQCGPPVVNFTGSPTNGLAALTVIFTNLSSGATNYAWNFGDGNTSAGVNPTNTYTNAGSYSVTLTAIGPGGTNALTRTNYIVVTNPPPPVVADFAGDPTNGVAPLTVAFTNLSSGTVSYTWDFGDGNSSTNDHPANTYTNAGSYSVTLTAIGPGGSNALTHTNYIVVTNPPPPVVADFAGDPTNGVAPLTVAFTNLSSGTASYVWNFGDGNSSTNDHPANTYTNAGSYSVTLTAIGPGGTNALTLTNYIVVTNPPPPVVADFAGDPTNGVAPLLVAFTNLTSGATSYAWDFGDGNTSTNDHPANTYTNAGSYSVILIAIGPGGTNALTRTNYIIVTNPPPPVVADFAGDPTNGVAPLTVTFTNLSSGAASYAWDFGDGNTSTNDHPANTYTNAGFYSVTLTAIGAGGTNALTRTNYILVINPPQLVVSPATLDFGIIATGATAQANFVVSNAGAATLSGTATVNDAAFAIVDAFAGLTSSVPFTVQASGTTNVVISFTPATQGNFSNAVLFVSNGGDSTNAVVGEGISAPVILWPALDGVDLTFSFETISGKTYLVQYKDSLADPVWQPLQSVPGDGTVKTTTNSTSAASQRFFRLCVQ